MRRFENLRCAALHVAQGAAGAAFAFSNCTYRRTKRVEENVSFWRAPAVTKAFCPKTERFTNRSDDATGPSGASNLWRVIMLLTVHLVGLLI